MYQQTTANSVAATKTFTIVTVKQQQPNNYSHTTVNGLTHVKYLLRYLQAFREEEYIQYYFYLISWIELLFYYYYITFVDRHYCVNNI